MTGTNAANLVQNRFALVAAAVALILAVPLVAMLFTEEVAWGPGDFALAGAVLLGAGLLFDRMVARGGTAGPRAAWAVALASALLLAWISLAVGIIRSEDHPANLMYAAVLAVGVGGALIARLRSSGMAKVMVAVALTHAVVTVAALFVGDIRTFVLNVFFVAAWAACAWLFSRAATRE